MLGRPNTLYEKRLRAAGHNIIVGVDEVGRGAWAGPLVACAVVLPVKPRIYGVRDSKKLSPKKREALAKKIESIALDIGFGIIPHQEIDCQGITAANQAAMLQAIEALKSKPDHVLVDTFTIFNLSVYHSAIPHGDAIVYSIAAASIVAKVKRDKMMNDLHEQYQEYGFNQHKGYGTAEHSQALQKYGLCAIHRRSFQPMRFMVK